MYYTYVLVKEGKAVYIGQTGNPQVRKWQHKKDKDFDKFLILKSFKTKRDALLAEKILIEFLSLFGSSDWYNSETIFSAIKKIELRGK